MQTLGKEVFNDSYLHKDDYFNKFHFLTKFHYLEMIRVDFKDQKPELLCQQKLKNDIIN